MKVKLDHDSDSVELTESFINSVNNTQLDLCFPLSYLKLNDTLFRNIQQVLKLLRKEKEVLTWLEQTTGVELRATY